MSKAIIVFDSGNATNCNRSVQYDSQIGKFSIGAGMIGGEIELDSNGLPVIEGGLPKVAVDSLGNAKRGPVVLKWEEQAIAIAYNGAYLYHGAWVGGGSSLSEEPSSNGHGLPGGWFTQAWR